MKTEQEKLDEIFYHSIQPKVEQLHRGIQKRIRIFYGTILAIYLIFIGLFLPEIEYINIIHVCGAILIILMGFVEIKVHSFKKLLKAFKDGKYDSFTFMTDWSNTSGTFGIVLLIPGVLSFESDLLLSILFGLMAVILFLLPLFNAAIIGHQVDYGTELVRVSVKIIGEDYLELKRVSYLTFKGDREEKKRILRKNLEKELEANHQFASAMSGKAYII